MSKQKKNNTLKVEEPRINEEIVGYDIVRLIYKDKDGNSDSEIVSLSEALNNAKSLGLDLIEINPKSEPPIVKIEEYSKYIYELKKRLKENKKPKNTIKEIQLSTNIADNDLCIKANRAIKFIESGDKVKVVLTMRGRELSRREKSKTSLYVFIDKLSEVAIPESLPRDEGNKCTVILKKKK